MNPKSFSTVLHSQIIYHALPVTPFKKEATSRLEYWLSECFIDLAQTSSPCCRCGSSTCWGWWGFSPSCRRSRWSGRRSRSRGTYIGEISAAIVKTGTVVVTLTNLVFTEHISTFSLTTFSSRTLETNKLKKYSTLWKSWFELSVDVNIWKLLKKKVFNNVFSTLSIDQNFF